MTVHQTEFYERSAKFTQHVVVGRCSPQCVEQGVAQVAVLPQSNHWLHVVMGAERLRHCVGGFNLAVLGCLLCENNNVTGKTKPTPTLTPSVHVV